MFPELQLINELLFAPLKLKISGLQKEVESQEYFAYTFQLAEFKIKFRKAKITPNKTGQFVTVWKRNEKGITEPHTIYDNFDFYIIATKDENNFGIFIFPKSILHSKGILSDSLKAGKRGFRVYPPWNTTTNKQAMNTQLWQTNYFVALSNDTIVNVQKLKDLKII